MARKLLLLAICILVVFLFGSCLIAQARTAFWGAWFLFLIWVGVVLYFLPTIIALARHKKNSSRIMLLNILLGWSVIAWVIAFIWALSLDD